MNKAVVLDPWVEPLPSPVPETSALGSSLQDHPRTPPELLVINSEAYTIWPENFEPLKEILHTWNGDSKETPTPKGLRARLCTLVRAEHQSFSDFKLLFAWGKKVQEELEFLNTTSELSLAFLDGDFDAALEKRPKASGEIETVGERDGKKEVRLVGNPGEIIVHL